MEQEKIHQLVQAQKAFFLTGQTFDVVWRWKQLARLEAAIYKYQPDIEQALYEDLGKDATEAWMTEIGMTLTELRWQKDHLFENAQVQRVPTPLTLFFARSRVVPMPYGNVLVMSPWNYPFLLAMAPCIEAMAAGNTVLLKPGAASKTLSQVLVNMIGEFFDPAYISVVTGGRQENTALLDEKFDFIFFTGSTHVGKTVMEKASRHLTPVLLELGGKSPCIVDETADLKVSAKRILFGKQLNSGQTCVAPDYLLVQESVHDQLLLELRHQAQIQMNHTGKIISESALERLNGLIEQERALGRKVFQVGEKEGRHLPLTLVDGVQWEDPIMQEEIFGPILPILTYGDFDSLMDRLKELPHPLAFYLFSRNPGHIAYVKTFAQFGGGCINDTIVHLANDHLPFGGVGASGMGVYHGKYGFAAFTHPKGIVEKGLWLDLPLRYRPYTGFTKKIMETFIK